MKRILGLLFIFTLLLSTTGLAGAQEPEIGTAADNACNEGGPMAGKCDTEWEWECGYYLARWLSGGGWSGTYTMPATCVLVLPPRPPVIVVEAPASSGPAALVFPVGGCLFNGQQFYFDFAGSYFLPAGSPVYDDNLCTTSSATTHRLIYAPAPFDATALCQTAFGTTVQVGPFGDDLYICNY